MEEHGCICIFFLDFPDCRPGRKTPRQTPIGHRATALEWDAAAVSGRGDLQLPLPERHALQLQGPLCPAVVRWGFGERVGGGNRKKNNKTTSNLKLGVTGEAEIAPPRAASANSANVTKAYSVGCGAPGSGRSRTSRTGPHHCSKKPRTSPSAVPGGRPHAHTRGCCRCWGPGGGGASRPATGPPNCRRLVGTGFQQNSGQQDWNDMQPQW